MYAFDDRVPHDTEHCGLCVLRADATRAAPPCGATPERVRFGPLPRDLVPFYVAERIELLSTYSSLPDRAAWEFAPVARSISGGGLDRNELTFEAGVTGALEHVGLVSVLRENRSRGCGRSCSTFTPSRTEGGRSGATRSSSATAATRRTWRTSYTRGSAWSVGWRGSGCTPDLERMSSIVTSPRRR
jgi:hypothetical protein